LEVQRDSRSDHSSSVEVTLSVPPATRSLEAVLLPSTRFLLLLPPTLLSSSSGCGPLTKDPPPYKQLVTAIFLKVTAIWYGPA
ncbi:hypothetical protein CLOM_g11323, partial [Closterium sp. NIES-68]